jgi:hypothetical protein
MITVSGGCDLAEKLANQAMTNLADRILPAWRRGHRVEEDQWHISIRPVPRLDQRSPASTLCSWSGARF